jgi:hypothetical protein
MLSVGTNGIDYNLFQNSMGFGSRDILEIWPDLKTCSFILACWKQRQLLECLSQGLLPTERRPRNSSLRSGGKLVLGPESPYVM